MHTHYPPSTSTPDDRDALADWLGGQLEAENVFDPTGEATTWIDIAVEDLAGRILASDWLAKHDRQVAAKALKAAADALEAQPPKLRGQYVTTLRLYADQPWRLGAGDADV